jgi:hypothetical protein
MATIYERRKRLEKEQKRMVRKLRALQDECPHPPERVEFTKTGVSYIALCRDCLKEAVREDAAETTSEM